MAGRTAAVFSVEIKAAASAMEPLRERPVAGAEACGPRSSPQASEERIMDRISLLLRCARRASALTLGGPGFEFSLTG